MNRNVPMPLPRLGRRSRADIPHTVLLRHLVIDYFQKLDELERLLLAKRNVRTTKDIERRSWELAQLHRVIAKRVSGLPLPPRVR